MQHFRCTDPAAPKMLHCTARTARAQGAHGAACVSLVLIVLQDVLQAVLYASAAPWHSLYFKLYFRLYCMLLKHLALTVLQAVLYPPTCRPLAGGGTCCGPRMSHWPWAGPQVCGGGEGML